jgi:membrane protein
MPAIWALLKETFQAWKADQAPRLAAALSYYTVFSLPPLLVILLAIVGLMFDGEQVSQALVTEFSELIAPQTAQAIGTVIDNVGTSASGPLASIVGVALLLLGASGVFGQLQDALNIIWKVSPRQEPGLKGLLRKRLFSFLMVLAVGFLLLVSLVLSTALTLLSAYLAQLLPGAASLIPVANVLISFLVITVFFALMFKFMPDAVTAWRDIWLGAAVTSVLFSLGKQVIGFYLARSSLASAFGAAASVILILAWVYYTAQIMFLGAEFTHAFANRHGQGTKPEAYAEPIATAARAGQGLQPAARPGRVP